MTVATWLKGLTAYWLIGCVLVGAALGGGANDCGPQNFKPQDVAAMAATWPMLIGYALTRRGADDACGGQSAAK